ncbi:MAG: DNA methylase [Arenimonas sp. SCN 70-307]|uniref:N-6 DNA methylase n=1 Tax=Arenimonas sp. SCN 70-307 TaxID=1660089 RepID=UPI00086AAE00|nr:N-6 DNA methylase [Arenimonas sp. SCN 70-307]ODS64607.1 MAG: DNA methylase [Arenimonas sp. SCN 70-307]
MSADHLSQWLDRLGYSAEAEALHRAGDHISPAHPYALEMHAMLQPQGAIQAQAVFDVEGVPTVVFVCERDGRPLTEAELDGVRQRLWNQNLASVVIAVEGNRASALPVRRLRRAEQPLDLAQARPDGPFSAAEVRSSDLSKRLPAWFDAKARVDRKLLDNLSAAVRQLVAAGLDRPQAQTLMGQVLFVSYLEHRNIVSDVYRTRRGVGTLHALVSARDRAGVAGLIGQLRADFNGDFLKAPEPAGDPSAPAVVDPWDALPDAGYELLDRFLSRVDLDNGQGDLWNYDFSFIPVELLSGLYESFLTAKEQAEDGAYYTPRHLATLTIDEAFAASPDPLKEVIFDGACGSGILLTTAYRKLIALSEARLERPLGFAARRDLLLRHIFGGDTNPMACRVTAFSLYLSLLEGLDPTDVLEAQERDDVKLPRLRGSNLCDGASADFFSDAHPFAGKRFTTCVSNPPWKEASGDAKSSDDYADSVQMPLVLRQLAGVYAVRALDFLVEGGTLCLILPITQLLGAGAKRYLPYLFDRIQPRRLINFGDLQGLLFPTAENTCHVLVAKRRPAAQIGRVSFTETFDYCVPKADLSLCFGRLTLQSADRHELQTQAAQEDPSLLTTFMWGDANDLDLLTRLSLGGTLGDFWRGGKQARWRNRKGVHFVDRGRSSVDSGPLREMPYVSTEGLKGGVPVLHASAKGDWPADQRTVVGLDAVLPVFDGPRVLYPDGFSRGEHNVRAVFVDGQLSFKSSIGVIAGPREDEALLRFVAIFLRSSLARYFLMLTCTKMLSERNGVHLDDIEAFPFFTPEQAPDPAHAQAALERAAAFSRELERLPSPHAQSMRFQEERGALDELVFDYFGLSPTERTLVRESVALLMPSIRPRSHKALFTPIQHRASVETLDYYAKALGDTLTMWRERMGGVGHFAVAVVATDPGRTGGVGVVRVQYLSEGTSPADVSCSVDDALVQETLQALRRHALDVVQRPYGLSLIPDQMLWTPRGLYLVRPLTRGGWLLRTALRDAERIVRQVQRRASREAAAA